MSNHEIKDPKEFDSQLRVLLTSDLNHVFNFNPLFNTLINNDAYLEELTKNHYARHENGGADEINVAGLSGVLADAQTPASHDNTAHNVNYATENGTYANLRAKATTKDDVGLGNVTNDEQATKVEFDDHSTRHENGGADEISLAGLQGESAELSSHKSEKASQEQLGHIKVGENLNIQEDGTLDAEAGMEEHGNEYHEPNFATEAELSSHKSDYAYHGELIAFPGYYIETVFDTPTEGDITETMKKSSDNSTFLTKITEFDEPTEGDITITVECVELGIHNKVITEFDSPTEGDITETASEVV